MIRYLTGHIINPVNDKIRIEVVDEPGAGGANHHYIVSKVPQELEYNGVALAEIKFQDGPINEVGINGVTQEVLLEIVADRLRSFQKGSFACRENALALTKIEEAQHWLQQRTLERMRRGVEGTSVK